MIEFFIVIILLSAIIIVLIQLFDPRRKEIRNVQKILLAKIHNISRTTDLTKISDDILNDIKNIAPLKVRGIGNVWTPKRLYIALKPLFELEAEYSAYIINILIPKRVIKYNLPKSLGGDIQMTIERMGLFEPELQEKAAEILACSLFILPTYISLGKLRSTYRDMGIYNIPQYLHEGMRSDYKIKMIVLKKINKLSPYTANLFI